MAILKGRGFDLGFGVWGGGHRKRLISYSPTLISSLLHDLSIFILDLDQDLNGGVRKPDSDLDLLI